MNLTDQLLAEIKALRIIDTHEHLPLERNLPKEADVLTEWLSQYFCWDLVSAGLTEKDLDYVRKNPRVDLRKRWAMIAPYWHAAESTGYGRALAITARDLFEIPVINEKTVVELNQRMMAARAQSGYYHRVLQEKSGIAISIRDTLDSDAQLESPDPFVFTLRTDPFIMPNHRVALREAGAAVGIRVHSLDDWVEVTRRTMEKYLARPTRVVCLKCGLAYHRSLRFGKASAADAEREFNEFFSDAHSAPWRSPIKPGAAFQDYMQHAVCKIADEHGLIYQIHTGIQEGNGNVLYHSDPTLLTNLFIEYENVKFDLFHMGYPYVMEVGTLAKNFRNVFIDMCWGHVISPEAARRALVEWLDVVPANKISAFGGDYVFVEGVYGHQYLARRNVAASLTQKVQDGSFDLDRAREIARWVFVENPTRLFGLRKLLKAKKTRS